MSSSPSRVRGVVTFLFCAVLSATVTAAQLIPTSGPRGARVIVTGNGLDDANLTLVFSGGEAARILSRSPSLLEAVVPVSASSGTVQLKSGSTALATFTFSVTADAPFVKVSTLAMSAKGNDLLKDPAGCSLFLPSGTTFVADRAHHRILSVQPNGQVLVIAGTGKSGHVDGAALQARFKDPGAVAVDTVRGLLYIADTGNHVIRRMTLDGALVTTLAGSGRQESSDGSGRDAGFKRPSALALDAEGNLYVADTGNSRIRRVTPEGVVSTIAGGTHSGLANGPAAQALFAEPEGLAVSASGVIYVADTKNHVRRLGHARRRVQISRRAFDHRVLARAGFARNECDHRRLGFRS